MSAGVAGLRASYGGALRDHLAHPTETTLRAAYELGREAVSAGTSVLELATLHHDALAEALHAVDAAGDAERVARVAADFHLESLSAFEMVQRGFRETREAARLERRHAALLRRLSDLLADASLAFDTTGSLEEMLQLVAEQARELTDAGRSRVTAIVEARRRPLEVISTSEDEGPSVARGSATLAAELTALDGRPLGTIELADPRAGGFRDVDDAVLAHVARMTSAAVERAQHYGS